MSVFKKIIAKSVLSLLSIGLVFSLGTSNNYAEDVQAEATDTIVQFGSGKTNNWTYSYQNEGSDYIGIATTSHYAQVTADNLFGSGFILSTNLRVTFKIGTYGGTGQQGTFAVALLDASNQIIASNTGSTALTGSEESYTQGPDITVTLPSNPEDIASVKVYLSDVGTITESKYVRLQELTLNFDKEVDLESPTLSSIAITTQPTKKSYFDGDSFDPSGMVVTATYSDSSTDDVTSLCTYTPNPLTVGTTSVTASYTEGAITETATISGVTVTAIVFNGISIKTPASKTTFALGEVFNSTGLIITADYNNDDLDEDLSSGFSVTGVDTFILGNQVATISYTDVNLSVTKTTTYSVTVTNQGASVGTLNLASDLFISEYIEGSSNNKAIEIFNGTGGSVDLSSYKVQTFSSGGTTANYTLELSGTLSNNDVYVISNSSANASIAAVSDITSSITYYNGDDAVALLKNDVIIDIIGDQLGDPGSAWTGTDANSESASTGEMTLVRAPSIFDPTTTFDFAEWIAYPQDTTTYLGLHEVNSADVTPLEQATAFANYVMTGVGLNASGTCGAVYAELDAEYNFMHADSITIFENNVDTLFVNARARMAYLEGWVTANPSMQEVHPDVVSNQIEVSMEIILIMSLLGASGVVYYIYRRKKQLQ